jgi:hypothetical protein
MFADGRLPADEFKSARAQLKREYEEMKDAAQRQAAGNPASLQKTLADIQARLLEKHKIYVVESFNVTDYHTQHIEVPAGLFRRLAQLEADVPRVAEPTGWRPPMFLVAVSVDYDSKGKNQQMLGVARRDLYVLVAENSFYANFVKGIIGMWCFMMLILAIAVACSSYLSGVISWLCTIFFVIAGLFVTDIQQLAENKDAQGQPIQGGGPIEAAVRLIKRLPVAGELDEGPARDVVTGADEFYRWWLRRFLNLVPDITRYDLHPYVANGFDISWSNVLFLDSILPLFGYLIPLAILAFYLMKYREIANPM